MKKFLFLCIVLGVMGTMYGQKPKAPSSPRGKTPSKGFNVSDLWSLRDYAPVAPATDLSWNEPTSGCSGSQTCTYNIYRGAVSGSEMKIVTGVVPTSYDDMSVTQGSSYCYEVTAVNNVAESGKSNEICVTIPFNANAPTNLVVTVQ